MNPRAPQDPLKVITVLGTRPEAIKLLPVVRRLASDERFESRLALTGQHREMVDQVLRPFRDGPGAVTPDIDLDIMRPGQSLNEIIARTVPRLDELYEDERPDVVVVQGDTTSAFAAGLAAFHRGIRVAHVEAGLRSYNRFHPFPEESNRRMLSAVVDLHLAPTAGAAEALGREGISDDDIVVTGNTAIDSLLLVLSQPGRLERAIAAEESAPAIEESRPLVLITLHRREAWSAPEDGARSPLEDILEGIARVAAARPDVAFVYPVHLNPRVQEPVRRRLGDLENVYLVDPLSYVPFVGFMARARCILTDSGGVQEEAPTLGVPVLVVRETTERPEGLRPGMNQLIGTDPDRIVEALENELDHPPEPVRLPCPNPYGDGRAAERVAGALLHASGRGPRPEAFRYEESDLIQNR